MEQYLESKSYTFAWNCAFQDEMFIFMEYCADGTISDVAKLGLPETMIRVYAYQILVAVSVLHEKGIVHRDVKGGFHCILGNNLYVLVGNIERQPIATALQCCCSSWKEYWRMQVTFLSGEKLYETNAMNN